MTSARSRNKTYHHGDLRPALIAAGLAIVERQGIAAVSLRAVARRAAVSHSAPYHHFASKAELLAAIAAAGFDRLVAAIDQAAGLLSRPAPLDGLRAVGAGYLQFALASPGVFRLMFRPELTLPAEHEVLSAAEARAFGKLLEAVVACQRGGALPGSDPRPIAAACWSTMHGLAVLHADQILGETPLGAIPIEALVPYVVEFATVGAIHTTPPADK